MCLPDSTCDKFVVWQRSLLNFSLHDKEETQGKDPTLLLEQVLSQFIFIVAQEYRRRDVRQVLDLRFGVMVGEFFLKQAGLVCPCNDKHI